MRSPLTVAQYIDILAPRPHPTTNMWKQQAWALAGRGGRRHTRASQYASVGVGTRGANQWVRCAHALAFLHLGRAMGGRGACRLIHRHPLFLVLAVLARPTTVTVANMWMLVDPPTPLTVAIILYVVCPTNYWNNMFHNLGHP